MEAGDPYPVNGFNMSLPEYTPFSSPITIRIGQAPVFPEIPQSFVDSIFERYSNPNALYDGTLICAHPENPLEKEAYSISYKQYLASRCYPNYEFEHQVFAVSGYILFQDQVLFGVRSEDVLSYSGYLELVPSGGLDERVILENQEVSFEQALRHEFEEETSFSCSFIEKITPKGLIYCSGHKLYDICCEIQLKKEAPIDASPSSEEYTDFFWIPLNKLETWVQKNADRILPTSHVILKQNLL